MKRQWEYLKCDKYVNHGKCYEAIVRAVETIEAAKAEVEEAK